MTAPIRNPPEPEVLIATVRDYEQITDVFREMKERLGLTNKFCDDVLGFTDGHTDKILGRSQQKRWGPTTLHAFMELFGIEFRVYVDMAAVKRMEAIWDQRQPRWFADAKPGRISKKILKAAKPVIYREMQQRSTAAKMVCFTAEHRSKIARKAAKSRWRKRRSKAARAAPAEKPERCVPVALVSC